MIDEFCKFLKREEMSTNTIQVYKQTVIMFLNLYKNVNSTNLLAFKNSSDK